jgi:hypothetical protein
MHSVDRMSSQKLASTPPVLLLSRYGGEGETRGGGKVKKEEAQAYARPSAL